MQRQTLGVLGLAILVSLAGCSALTGPIEFSASEATVSDGAVQETGYEEKSVEKQVIEREITRAGVTKEVHVTNWQAMYERSVDLGPLGQQRAAVVSVFSTPKVELAGQGPYNPVADYSNAELVQLVQEQYEGMHDVEQASERELSILGETVTVTTFSATATLEGSGEVDVFLHVAKVPHGDDFVIAVGVHPQRLPDEQQRIDAMFQNIEHESD